MKKIFLKNLNIRNYFIAFAFALIAFITSFYLYLTWKTYCNNVITILQRQSARIERSFTDSADYTEYLMNYINNQIASHGSKNLNYINSLLSSFRLNQDVNDKIPWNMFSWSDNNLKLIVNSDKGIVTPIDVSGREYIQMTIVYPGKMHFGKATYGKVSNKKIIPSGMGIFDKNKKYIGAIIFGFQIDKLSHKLQESLNTDNVQFALLDEDFEIVLNSDNFEVNQKILNKIKKVDFKKSNSEILTDFSFFNKNSTFSFYQKIDKYPYIILTIYDRDSFKQELYSKLLPYFFELLFILIAVTFVVLLIRKFLIKPISQLSIAAEFISQDRDNEIVLPKSNIKEIVNLSKQLAAIEKYKLELIEAKKSQSRFFANMSHELRTPLNGIINISHMIKNEVCGALNTEYKDLIGDVEKAGNHLLSLINDILDFAKMDAKKMEIVESKINIKEEINYLIKWIISEARKNDVKINSNLPDNLPEISADIKMFKQIILNLLSNAVKFSNKGGIINIDVKINNKGEMEVSVADNGIGIKEEDLSRIAIEFGQVGAGYIRGERQGTGLGLSLTKKIVELHGGKLLIKSVFGKGTTVTVLFPKERVLVG